MALCVCFGWWLLGVINATETWHRCWEDVNFDREFPQESFSLYKEHIAMMQPWEAFVPKHHVTFHLLLNSAEQGHPEMYAHWEDEALNKMLKACCCYISQVTFEGSCLLRMRELLRTRVAKRPRE